MDGLMTVEFPVPGDPRETRLEEKKCRVGRIKNRSFGMRCPPVMRCDNDAIGGDEISLVDALYWKT